MFSRSRDALDQPEAADHRPGAARLDHVAADVAVASHDGVDDRRERDAERAQPVRIHVDLVLPNDAADAGHLRDAGHGIELVADEPVLERAQLLQRVALALHRVPEDVADPGGVRPERRHHPRRQRLGKEIQALEHTRAGEVEVHRVLEDHVDHREAEGGGGADHPHARQSLEAHRERIRDLVLHFLRRAARPVGEHDHLVVGQVRDGVDGRGEQRPVPPAPEEQEEGDHEDAVPQRRVDQPVDHWLSLGLPRHTPGTAVRMTAGGRGPARADQVARALSESGLQERGADFGGASRT